MKATTAVLYLAFVSVIFLVAGSIGPLVETRFFPVFGKFQILNIDPAPNGKDTLMTVRFYKLRDCAPLGFGWYIGDLGNFTQSLNIVSNRQNPAPMLPVGRGTSTFTIVDLLISDADIPKLHAETFSRCHPFRVTRSEVFP